MKNSQKGFVVPLLVGIIVILVVGGGVYIYETKKVEVPEVSNNTSQSNQIRQTNIDDSSAVNQQKISDDSSSTKTTSVITSTPVKSSPSVSGISIRSPKNGDTWKRSSLQKIQWDWVDAVKGSQGDKISIYIKIPCLAGYTCDTFAPYNGNFTIVKDTYNTGSYDWTVGQTIECREGNTKQCPVPNTGYQLKVCSSDGKVCDSRDITISN